MTAHRTDSQKKLAFDDAEAAHIGRWNDVSLALARIGNKCDLHLSRFVRLVFDITKGGTSGALVKSYAALSERPAWLCCSTSKVRNTVEAAEKAGLVSISNRRSIGGSQQENSYTINWSGIWQILGGTGVATEQGPASTEQGPASTEQGPALWRHHNKEYKLLGSYLEVNSGSGPEAEPIPRSESNSLSDAQTLAVELCAGSPILNAASGTTVAPLPPGDLLHGCFATIEERHLASPLGFVKWHRMQLATVRPPMGNTEADLLLTLATALYAASLRSGDVKRNRVAIFVNTIVRRAFAKSLPFVPEARSLLDQGIAERGATWAGLAVEPTPAGVST